MTEQFQSPIHEDGGWWWFWEETWADRQGPFASREAAVQALERYAFYLEHGDGSLTDAGKRGLITHIYELYDWAQSGHIWDSQPDMGAEGGRRLLRPSAKRAAESILMLLTYAKCLENSMQSDD